MRGIAEEIWAKPLNHVAQRKGVAQHFLEHGAALAKVARHQLKQRDKLNSAESQTSAPHRSQPSQPADEIWPIHAQVTEADHRADPP